MKPDKPSPWITAIPGDAKRTDGSGVDEGPVRFWLPQPRWFRGPLLAVAVLLPLLALLYYAKWSGQSPLAAVLLAAAGLLAVGLVLLTHSARMTLQERGITIRKLAADQFIPYRQISVVRTYARGFGRHQQRFVEVSLRSGDVVLLEVGDPERIRLGIHSCKASWERTLDDDEQAPARVRDREGGPYRGSDDG